MVNKRQDDNVTATAAVVEDKDKDVVTECSELDSIFNFDKEVQCYKGQWSINQESLESVKIYVDASAPEFVRSLKVLVGEDDNPSYIKEQLDFCKKNDLNPADYMTVVPVPFNPEAKNMLIHTKELLEYEARPLIGINSKFDKLITTLRTAVSDDMGSCPVPGFLRVHIC